MNFIRSFWNKICVPLDGFLWHRDISHPIIRPMLRNEILGAGFFLLLGVAALDALPWLFWFGCGMACMTWIFWSWSRFFLKASLADYGSALLRSVFAGFVLRLAVLAFLLYLALAVFTAPIMAIVAGLVAGSMLALASYAWNMRNNP